MYTEKVEKFYREAQKNLVCEFMRGNAKVCERGDDILIVTNGYFCYVIPKEFFILNYTAVTEYSPLKDLFNRSFKDANFEYCFTQHIAENKSRDVYRYKSEDGEVVYFLKKVLKNFVDKYFDTILKIKVSSSKTVAQVFIDDVLVGYAMPALVVE